MENHNGRSETKKIMKQWEHYSPLADDGHKENKWVYKKEGSFGDVSPMSSD